MSSTFVLIVLSYFLQSIQGTFPPVSNPPPIPVQPIRSLDISGQHVYIQDDSNLPQNVIKEEGYSIPDSKVDDQRWFVSENQSGERGDFLSSTEAFDRYYSNGLPAVGPVATPLPDETYFAQPSGTSKILPDANGNIRPSDIWVLTKGPNDQYISERLVQVQVSDDRIFEVVNQQAKPKVVSEAVSSIPSTPVAIKNAGPPALPAKVQQVWVRAPQPQAQKIVQNTATTYVEETPYNKQIFDVPQPNVEQYIQTQIVKEPQPLPPPNVQRKSSSFVVPPPLPPLYKGIDVSSPKQAVIVNQPITQFIEKSGDLSGKNGVPTQVKHIWIPTSPQTGKFITVPVVDSGKSVPAKGIPVDLPPPVAVSDTWVLKQDGTLPRFEQQKSTVSQLISNGNVLVPETQVLQFDSPKNPPLIGKSIDAAVPGSIWPSKNFADPKLGGKSEIIQPALSPPLAKSNGVLVGTTVSTQPAFPQKTYISASKVLQPPLPGPLLPPTAPIIKGKPCPIVPQKSSFSGKSVPIQAYRSVAVINRQPFARIIRLNRYPYGSYYVLNPRIRPTLYAYPRIQAPIMQQNRNGLVRLMATRQIGVPVPIRQFAFQVPKRQTVVPLPQVKSVAPIAQSQILYPSVQTINRLRYAFPFGSYLRSVPVAGRNIFSLPPIKSAKLEVLTSSSSESSSSESSSSESKSAESKPKKVKKSKEVESSVSSTESEEQQSTNEPEKESEAEPDVSESAPKEIEEVPAETETQDSLEPAESQLRSQSVHQSRIDLDKENFEILGKPYLFRNGIFRNVLYLPNTDRYRTQILSNGQGMMSRKSDNFIIGTTEESTTIKTKDSELSENLPTDL